MIPVQPRPEPADFDAKVRQPGLSAIDELVGREPRLTRTGPKRKKVAETEADLKQKHFPPIWRKAIPDLLAAYDRVCAFVAVYIERVTGAATVDHMVPKSTCWQDVYEWSNYRLACAWANTQKGILDVVVDPFDVGRDWFRLEFVAFQVLPGEGFDDALRERIEATAALLSDGECCELRAEWAEAYWDGDISLARLERRAPFVARELHRQGRLNPRDVAVLETPATDPDVDG